MEKHWATFYATTLHGNAGPSLLWMDIFDFPESIREPIARDIVDSMARGGSAADWCVTDGILVADFAPLPGVHNVVSNDLVHVVVKIVRKQGEAWLCIHMRFIKQDKAGICEQACNSDFVQAIGVNNDATWLTNPMRYWDDYENETIEWEHLTKFETFQEYTKRTVYGNELFEIGHNMYTTKWPDW